MIIAQVTIVDTANALTQVLDMVRYGRVRSTDAIMVAIKCETICLHGDGDHAVEFARLIRDQLLNNKITIAAPKLETRN